MAATKVDWVAYIRQMRPKQWVKNTLVFLPAFAAHNFSALTLLQSFAAFISFSLCASAGYVINDIFDLENDRCHAIKSLRPLASGRIQVSHAILMAIALQLGAAAIAIWISDLLLVVVSLYFASTTAYSAILKKYALIDVVTLSFLYSLRVIAGGVATSISISPWLLAFSLFFFLALAILKRYVELINRLSKGKNSAVGRSYTIGDLPILASLAAASGFSAVVVFALYLNSPAVIAQYARPEFLWIVCVLLAYWISRALLLAHRGLIDEEPIDFALTDRVSLLTGAAIASVIVVAGAWPFGAGQ
jgi:4-hydroxybenzoate polyprenyltransferase